MTALGVEPLTPDADPGLIVTSTVDRAGQRLLPLMNVGSTRAEFARSYRGRSISTGRRLPLPARNGVMLPHDVRIGTTTLLEITCELAEAIHYGSLALRPTHGDGTNVAVFDTAPTTVDGGGLWPEGMTHTMTAHQADPCASFP